MKQTLTALVLALLVTGCASRSAYNVSRVAFAAATVADVHSTQLALDAGYVEKNKWMPSALAGRIAVKAAWGVPFVLFVNHVAKTNRIAATVINAAVAGVWTVYSVKNYRLAGSR